jgi:hypothetical protein
VRRRPLNEQTRRVLEAVDYRWSGDLEPVTRLGQLVGRHVDSGGRDRIAADDALLTGWFRDAVLEFLPHPGPGDWNDVLLRRRAAVPGLIRITPRPRHPVVLHRPPPRLRLVHLPVLPAVVTPVLQDPRADRQHLAVGAPAAVATPHALQFPGIPHAFDRAP